ncbi:MAG: AbrB/MazE/SpoVT family DNA-binding domain-containing protein, partial [Chloroflexota bacterium]
VVPYTQVVRQMAVEYARKTVALRRTGGSMSVVLPKAWLQQLGISGDVDLVCTDAGIVVEPAKREAPSIEDEPEFAQFLAFLAKDALAHSEQLGDVGELTAGDDELFAGIEPE